MDFPRLVRSNKEREQHCGHLLERCLRSRCVRWWRCLGPASIAPQHVLKVFSYAMAVCRQMEKDRRV
ncbi:unnamed protein product [Dicrocoelium dendriticum]|nr:unnamed protein product [Dicrocoelium dendriticum]